MERCEVGTGKGKVVALAKDEKRCRMVSEEVHNECVICDSRVGEDVPHFLVGCGEFERDRQMPLENKIIIITIYYKSSFIT